MDQQPAPAQEPAPQPQWTPPPQPASGWAQNEHATGPARPSGVTLAGVFYIAVGVLVTLFGFGVLVVGQAIGGLEGVLEVPGLAGAASGVVTVLAALILVLGILFFVSGVGVLLGKNWARLIGMTVGVIGAVIGVLSVIGALSQLEEIGIAGLLIWVLITILFIASVWALGRSGTYFAYRR